MFQYTEAKPSKSKAPLIILLFAIASLLIIGAYFIFFNADSKRITLDGNAMSPTLLKGSTIEIEARPSFGRGDIVVFTDPQNSGTKHTRRIVALEGESVQISKGQVLINGFARPEPYVKEAATKDFAPVTVPPGHVFVLGDNRNNSGDSRDFGFVPLRNILGIAKL